MNDAQREHQRAYNRSWYAANKKRRYATIKAHYARTKLWFKQYKATLQCARCPENHPACLQFHHKNPRTKVLEVTECVARNWSRKRIMQEIRKCEVLCANCHAKEHWRKRRRLPK